MIKKIILIVTTALFVWGCNSAENKQRLTLKTVEEVVFKANDLMPVNPSKMQFVEADSGNYLFAYNHRMKSYKFITFGTGEVGWEVPIQSSFAKR